jgi:vancomycin resistance protein VanW
MPSLKIFALMAMPLALALFLWLTNPFRDELVREVYSLASLSPSQTYNIELAARSLDGRVLKCGELFSFNRAVGPRRGEKGYRPAPTYVGPDSPATVGGGICLVSSALYQAALAVGLKIEARSPHLRTIASVTPGLDATVWYGRQDLKFRNNTGKPLQIKAECRNHNLYISLLGERSSQTPVAQLKTVTARKTDRELMVEVFRDIDNKRTFVSRDLYQINR